MVLEYVLDVFKVENKPWDAFFLGMIYVFVSSFLAFELFPSNQSIVSVLLVVVASVPLVYDAIRFEEREDFSLSDESHILSQHKRFVLFVLLLFFGFSAGFFLLYSFLPSSVSSSLFSSQISTINNVDSLSGSFYSPTHSLFFIFFNNLKVLTFCLLFSFLYGSGAIFILSWNASVFGVAVGVFFKKMISSVAPSLSSYFAVGAVSVLRYSLHGIPEISAYLLAGLAGSLVSMAVVNHDFRSKYFYKVLDDSSDLLLISVVLLFFAALIEVFITPLFF